jgi:hypothetical protein
VHVHSGVCRESHPYFRFRQAEGLYFDQIRAGVEVTTIGQGCRQISSKRTSNAPRTEKVRVRVCVLAQDRTPDDYLTMQPKPVRKPFCEEVCVEAVQN